MSCYLLFIGFSVFVVVVWSMSYTGILSNVLDKYEIPVDIDTETALRNLKAKNVVNSTIHNPIELSNIEHELRQVKARITVLRNDLARKTAQVALLGSTKDSKNIEYATLLSKRQGFGSISSMVNKIQALQDEILALENQLSTILTP